ncbi:MAG: hypothetical protein H0W75_05785 [Chitinophagaceae bacterium]|nr:hypothetical protein [Chitinophagaceae bacterium]
MSEIKTHEQARNYTNAILQDIETIKEGLIKPQESLLYFSFQFGTVYINMINKLLDLQEYLTDGINISLSGKDITIASSRDNSKTPLIETK